MFVDAYITQKSNFFSRKYIENTQNTLLHMVKSLSKPASVIPPLNHAWAQIVSYAKISFGWNLWKSYTREVFRMILLNGINGKKSDDGWTEKVQNQETMKDLLNSLEDQIKPSLFHYFINKEQAKAYNKCRQNATETNSNKAMVQMDFSENFTCCY